MSNPLREERRGPVALLTLDRPERRNALSPALIDALSSALSAATDDADVRAVVITGAGTHFCAGGDLVADGALAPGMLAGHRARGGFADLLRRLARSPLPVVAAVNGDALGGGFGLAAACHLVVADEAARFATPELKLGLFPMMIQPVLARNLPRKLLHEMVLTGRKLSAEEARALGFVNRVAPARQAVDLALGMAEEIAGRSPAIVELGLRAMAAVDDLDLDAALDHMHAQLTLNLLTEDAAEGITAFLSRRPPSWKGR